MIIIFQYPGMSLWFLTLQYKIGVNDIGHCKFRVADFLFSYEIFRSD